MNEYDVVRYTCARLGNFKLEPYYSWTIHTVIIEGFYECIENDLDSVKYAKILYSRIPHGVRYIEGAVKTIPYIAEYVLPAIDKLKVLG